MRALFPLLTSFLSFKLLIIWRLTSWIWRCILWSECHGNTFIPCLLSRKCEEQSIILKSVYSVYYIRNIRKDRYFFFHILYSIQTRALEDEEWPDMFSCRLVFCFLVRKHDFTCHDVTSLEVVSWFSMLLYNLRSSIIHTSTKKRCQGNYISYYSN